MLEDTDITMIPTANRSSFWDGSPSRSGTFLPSNFQTAPRVKNAMPYMASLDGIRAVAILAVLLFHIWPAALTGGFTGVDVFFVLSGFLITSIILHDLRAGTFSLKEFYVRRILRLLPNVVVTVLAVLLLWTFFMPPSAAVEPAQHGLWTLFNLSNVYIWRNLGSYWGPDASVAPLTHFWSLGIEEQFYLLFPSALLMLTRFQSGRVRHWLSLIAILSFSMCLYGTYTHPQATFYLLPTRVWELLLGAILAAWRARADPQRPLLLFLSGNKAREMIGWIGLGLIAAGFFRINASSRFPGLAALIPTTGTVLVLLSAVTGESRVSRLLSTPFMVATGKLSYSLYLWHWPLIAFGKMQAEFYGLPELAGAAAGGLCGVLMGWIAFVGVEKPLRLHGPGRSWRLGVLSLGFGATAVCCGFIALHLPIVDPTNRYDKQTFSIGVYDAAKNAGYEDGITSVALFDLNFPPLPPRHDDAWRTGGIVHSYDGGRPKVLVLGSSHAVMYSRLIDNICRQKGISVAFLGVCHGTPAFFDATVNPDFPTKKEAQEFDEARVKWLRVWHPEAVFVIDRWDNRLKPDRDFATQLRSFCKVVSPLAGRVIFVAQVPAAEQGERINLRGFVNWRWAQQKGRGEEPRLAPDAMEPVRKDIIVAANAAATDIPNLSVLRPDLTFYKKDGSIRYAEGRKFFYADDDHLNDAGVEEVRPLFEKAIAEAHAAAASR